MATVRPFRGIRPVPKLAADVASKPYDVLSSEEARSEAAGNPYSFLHVGKPEIDLPAGTDIHDDQVYRKGRENFERFLAGGILQQDDHPSLYIYRLTMGHHSQTGIVGCTSVAEYNNNTIRKHELTRRDKEADRTRHILETNSHSGPILMAYHVNADIDGLVQDITTRKPVYDFRSRDDIRHELWVVADDKTLTNLTRMFAAIPVLYIADGHHRSAAAARAAKERQAQNPSHSGNEEYNFFLSVLFPHNQLQILEYNRVLRDLNGLTVDNLLAQLKGKFDVSASPTPVRPARKGTFGLYVDRRWYTLASSRALLATEDPVERLDVSILQHHVLAPLFGVSDPRTDKRIDFVGGIRGVVELERRVNSGEMAAAFSLYPTSIEELLRIADTGNIMPPKSTWFEPKLRDGIVVHLLD